MRLSRWQFNGGTVGIGLPDQTKNQVRLLNDATFINNRMVPMALPDTNQGTAVPITARHLWRHRGQSYTAANPRSYVALRFGFGETLAWTEWGQDPRWLCHGLPIPLGLPRPQKAPVMTTQDPVSTTLTEVTSSVIPFAAGTTLYYRFVFATPFGVFAPTASLAHVTAAACMIHFEFNRATYATPIDNILVFRGTEAGKELLIGDTAGAFAFDDTGQPQGSQLATDYDPIGTTTQYIYTFQGDGYESAPSRVSDEIKTAGSTLLGFDLLNDGYWDQTGLQTYTFSGSVSVLGPMAMSRRNPSTGAVAAPSAGMDLASSLLYGGRCVVADGSAWIGGAGVELRDATGAPLGLQQILWSPKDGQDTSNAWMVRLPDLPTFNPAATSYRSVHGGFVKGWTFDGVRGGFLVDLGDSTLATGEKVVFLLLDSTDPTKILGRTTMTAFRSSNSSTAVWFVGATGWTWTTGQTILWARAGLVVSITPAQALALSGLADGTLVRFTSSGLLGGVGQVAQAYLSPTILFLQMDTTNLESVETSLTDLTLEYFPFNNGILSRAIYRVGDTGEFLRVGEVALGEKVFCDSASTTTLGDPPSSVTTLASGAVLLDEPPPRGLSFLTEHEGCLFGLDREMVRWTRRGAPHAWPSQLSASIPGARALVSLGMGLLVMTEWGGVRLDGGDPTAFLQQETSITDGIVAPWSLVATPAGAIYLGPRGLMVADGHQAKCLTDEKLRPWHLFPRAQQNTVSVLPPTAGTTLPPGNVLDSLKGSGSSWAAFMEMAITRALLAEDGAFGLALATDTLLTRQAVGCYFNGYYYIYLPLNPTNEGQGSWRLNLATGALTHLGLQPYWMAVEGSDLFLLFTQDVDFTVS